MINFIKKWSLALRWWLVFMLINLGTVFILFTGIVDDVNKADFTKLSFVIYATFYIFSVQSGIHAYRISKKQPTTEPEIDEYRSKDEPGWFVAESLLTIGMIGTVLGFIYMLSLSFGGLAAVNVLTIQAALVKMSAGMSTALYTTAAGLICSLLLKIQLFDLSQHLDKLSTKCGCKVKNEA